MRRKQELRQQILSHILLRGKATRPELVEHLRTRAATVFDVVDELKTTGFLIEPERKSKRTGRKAPELECRPEAGHWLGVDFQLHRTIGVVIDATGKVLHAEELQCERRSLNDCRREIAELIRRLRTLAGDRWELVRGIGFADPGMVDVERGVSLRAVSVPGWENAATGEWLGAEYRKPVGIWPESMIKTNMEYMLRQPEAPESLFLLSMNDGIGGGFIQNGELFEGASGQGMEIGHLVIDPAGPVCKCGNRGCVEALTGINGLRNLLREAVRNGVETSLVPERFTSAEFLALVKTDKAARIIAEKVCSNLGRALSAVVTLLNPETIVFSGELTGLGNVLFDAVRRELALNCFSGAIRNLKLELSKLDQFDTARGAAIRMRNRLWLEE